MTPTGTAEAGRGDPPQPSPRDRDRHGPLHGDAARAQGERALRIPGVAHPAGPATRPATRGPGPRSAALAALGALGALLLALPVRAMDVDLYARMLEQHTVPVDDIASTRVDYAALRSSQAWRALLQSLRESDPQRLRSREERLAFWINAYNILAIDIVRRHYPVDSIRSIGGLFSPVWKKEAGEIGGRDYTLHEIEHEILRPMGEPRIHGAIVCASLSCPPLRREPYRPQHLDAQLDDNVRAWLADPRKGARIDRSTGAIYLSPIFDWFEEDFGDDPVSFVASHLPPEEASWLRNRNGRLRIRYLDYDWSLNAARKRSTT